MLCNNILKVNYMSDIKYCPNCQKEVDASLKHCECGYEFYIKQVEDEVASTNTTVIVDNVPEFVWKLISLLCPIVGIILSFVWKKKWPERSKILFKVSLGMIIFLVVVAAIAIFVVVGKARGDIV